MYDLTGKMAEIEQIQLDFDTSHMNSDAIKAAKIRKYMLDNNMITSAQAGRYDSWTITPEDATSAFYKKMLKEAQKQTASMQETAKNLQSLVKVNILSEKRKRNIENLLCFALGGLLSAAIYYVFNSLIL